MLYRPNFGSKLFSFPRLFKTHYANRPNRNKNSQTSAQCDNRVLSKDVFLNKYLIKQSEIFIFYMSYNKNRCSFA